MTFVDLSENFFILRVFSQWFFLFYLIMNGLLSEWLDVSIRIAL